jgi:hypothetical protein
VHRPGGTGNPDRSNIMSKQVQHYTVEADRETGEWITEPQHVGAVELIEWNERQDTDDVHFDTYEKDDETRAIEVRWVD